jgi:tetratricopeptide (TPR) repeat protein
MHVASIKAGPLADMDGAVEAIKEALDSAPNDKDALAALVDLEEHRGDFEALEEALLRQSGVLTGNEQIDVLSKLASNACEKLGDSERALVYLQQILSTDPEHHGAFAETERLLTSLERWQEAADALEKASAAATTPQAKADVVCRRAAIRSATGANPEEVAALYQVALAHDPKWLPAIDALEAIARQTDNVAQLAVLLSARIDLEYDEGKLKSLLSEVAALYLGPLDMPGEAVAALDRLAKLSPSDLTVQENLGRALIAAGRVDEGELALGHLVEQLSKVRRQKDVARLQCTLGSYAEARGDLASAKQRYTSAYQIDPTQAAVLGALSRLSVRQHDADSARRYLRTLLLQSFDEKAAGITKAEVYLALGDLHREAGEHSKARNMFERGLETDPKNQALKQALAAVPK